MKPLKFFIGLVLIPLVAAQAMTLADLAAVWWPAQQWFQGWFPWFAGGFLIWLAIYFALPRPVWFYVLGHELTHALAVYIAGGRVYDFKVSADGGHVRTDTVNWWITLSPYFIPLYSLIWLGLWISVDFYYPLQHLGPLLFAGLGFTWGFHVLFTLSMVRIHQTDLSSQGYLFSGVIILVFNLLFLHIFLATAAQPVTWKHLFASLRKNTTASYLRVGTTFRDSALYAKKSLSR